MVLQQNIFNKHLYNAFSHCLVKDDAHSILNYIENEELDAF
jgi:hypothetical protein